MTEKTFRQVLSRCDLSNSASSLDITEQSDSSLSDSLPSDPILSNHLTLKPDAFLSEASFETIAKKESHKLKWFLMFLSIAVVVPCSLLIPGIGPLLPGMILGSLLLNSGLHVYFSIDRLKTIGNFIALLQGALTAVMFLSVMSINPISCVLMLACFVTNKTLFSFDVPPLLKSIKHYFENIASYWQSGEYKIVAKMLSKAFLLSAASVAAAYLLTAATYVGMMKLLASIGFIGSMISVPYIIIPIMCICFIANLAFCSRGVDKTAKSLIEMLKKVKESVITKSAYPILGFLFDIDKSDTAKQKAAKAFLGGIKVGLVIAIAYFSQIGLVDKLIPSLQQIPHLGVAFNNAVLFATVVTLSMATRFSLMAKKIMDVSGWLASGVYLLMLKLKKTICCGCSTEDNQSNLTDKFEFLKYYGQSLNFIENAPFYGGPIDWDKINRLYEKSKRVNSEGEISDKELTEKILQTVREDWKKANSAEKAVAYINSAAESFLALLNPLFCIVNALGNALLANVNAVDAVSNGAASYSAVSYAFFGRYNPDKVDRVVYFSREANRGCAAN